MPQTRKTVRPPTSSNSRAVESTLVPDDKAPKKKAVRDTGVGFNRKQITQASGVPCSVMAKRSYSAAAKSCYTTDQLRKMVRVLAQYPAENPGAIPPKAEPYDPTEMLPYAKKHRKKAGLVETLEVPLGARQESWPDKLPYGFSASKTSGSKGYMNDARIKPRAYAKEELEARWKLPNDAHGAATWCDRDAVQAGIARLAPRIVVVDLGLRPGNPLYDTKRFTSIKKRIRAAVSERAGAASKFYVWVYNPGNHWTVFINDQRNGRNRGYYIDSFGGPMPGVFKKLVKELKITPANLTVNEHRFQRDGAQCGMWTIFFAYSIYKGDKLQALIDSKVSDKDMKKMRKVLFVQGKKLDAAVAARVVEM